ncbi:MAG: ABC transporter permease [Actinomycetota bacterium]|nr:ABC transporter permease [Actinomycetota bacterium]
MTFTDRLYALAFAARLSWRDFLAVYPPRVYLFTTLPRVVLQAAFFALIGYYAAGESGREFAFIGGCAHVIVLATVVRAPDVLIDERVMGTLHRVRLGVMPLPAIVAARWWVYVCAGLVDALVAAVLVGAFVGELDLVPELLAAAPLFLLVALTTSGLGLVVAALSLTQRIDVLLTNLAAYLVLVFGGIVAPISVFGDVGATIVRLLPLTNGLLAIRSFVAGEPWVAEAALEVAVGAAWIALAAVLIQVQSHRARHRGSDELL